MSSIQTRLDAWLVAREQVGWFDGWPHRHGLRSQLRSAMRYFDVDAPPVCALLFALARSAWDENHVIDVRHYPDGYIHVSVSELRGGRVVYERGAMPPGEAHMTLLEAAP